MPSISKLLSEAAPNGSNDLLASNTLAKAHLSSPDPSKTKRYVTSLPTAAFTLERRLYIPSPSDKLIDPGVARANLAASREAPDGTRGWAEAHTHQTVLQQHCGYWDADGDGVIWPGDIFGGCRAWGWHPLLCLVVVLVIAPTMSYPTLPRGRWLPDARLPIYLDRIHKAKHGSDSNTYDSEGRFRPQQFEDFFVKYDAGERGGLDLYDLARAWKGQRILADPFGWTASVLEWMALYLLIWPEDGVLRKEDVRASFDGSLFQKKADQWAERKKR